MIVYVYTLSEDIQKFFFNNLLSGKNLQNYMSANKIYIHILISRRCQRYVTFLFHNIAKCDIFLFNFDIRLKSLLNYF